MPSKKVSSLPLLFRAAAFYAFFSIFFLNAQPFFGDWNDPFGLFIQKVYSVFSPDDAVSETNQQITSDGVVFDPAPPPPPPKP